MKLIVPLLFLALVLSIGGFAVLAAWDMPVVEAPVEKTLENTRFLEKNT